MISLKKYNALWHSYQKYKKANPNTIISFEKFMEIKLNIIERSE